MDFKPSPERQILFDTLKKYFENEYSLSDRNIAAHSDLGYSKKAWEAMRDLGILESLIDPELDGFGGTALDISTVFEALGRGLVVEPFLEVGILAAKVLSKGNDVQKSLVKKILKNEGVSVNGFVSEIGKVKADSINHKNINNKYFFSDESKLSELDSMFKDLIEEGNSVGAKLGVIVENCPVGLGDPVFEKLDANLAKAIMTINAVKSVSIGNADDLLSLKGSEARDEITESGFTSNNSGGILGGISNGDDISLSFIIKPTSSIKTKGKTVNKEGNEVDIEVTGRHDPCVGIRAVPIAEAMVSLVLVDHLLINKAQCADVEQNLPFSE